MINGYNTKTFHEVFPSSKEFLDCYNEIGFPKKLKEENVELLYYLLFARYGNSPIANDSVEQFQTKVFSIVFQYGPTWQRRLEIQDALRQMSEEELMKGSKQILNHALNPSENPTEQSMDELQYIDAQNTTNYKRSKLDAYGMLWELMKVDVTEGFIRTFEDLFKKFVLFENPILYNDDEC